VAGDSSAWMRGPIWADDLAIRTSADAASSSGPAVGYAGSGNEDRFCCIELPRPKSDAAGKSAASGDRSLQVEPAGGTQVARTATREERLLQSWDRIHSMYDRMDETADRCGKLAAELNRASRARAAARQEQLEQVVDRLRAASVRIAESSLQGSFGEVDRRMKDMEQDPGDGTAGGGARQATGSTDNEEDMDISDDAEGEP